MAYSSGFNPHPRISYAGAAPTGAASEAEYVEIGLREPIDIADARQRLDVALPPGLDILDVVESSGGALADRLEASRWLITLTDLTPDAAVEPVARLLDADEVIVERMTKRGVRSFDCRAAIVSLRASEGTECAILDMVLRHGEPATRPDDILTGLRQMGLPDSAAMSQRLTQGPLDGETGMVGDPLALDRDATLTERSSAGS